tara:strand:- start:482 stop:1084 length:603 start_codon:yes stop_codon:yes gene_type:complete
MNTKKNFQYLMIFLLVLISAIFYFKYFSDQPQELKKQSTLDIENENKPALAKNEVDENIIQNLRYTSEDLQGNIYTITAESAQLIDDKLSEVQLYKVYAEINQKNQETIFINSEAANYNKLNNNTIFKKKVNVKYGEQIINSEILKLNFLNNLIEILDNVYYTSKNTEIYADKVEINLLYKKLKISMINNKDKVKVTGKY